METRGHPFADSRIASNSPFSIAARIAFLPIPSSRDTAGRVKSFEISAVFMMISPFWKRPSQTAWRVESDLILKDQGPLSEGKSRRMPSSIRFRSARLWRSNFSIWLGFSP